LIFHKVLRKIACTATGIANKDHGRRPKARINAAWIASMVEQALLIAAMVSGLSGKAPRRAALDNSRRLAAMSDAPSIANI
ncbi:MAG: hypothetical protein AAGF13_05440, partial [Pseudomonadota bacterium]